MSEHLRFSPDILARLGEELVPDIDQGIVELVKNAYDADAEECTVELNDLLSGVGSIIVRDTGVGMTAQSLRQGWLVIGRSGKREKSLTARYRRLPVGDKGLGRLAALRLGRRVVMSTRPAAEPGCEYRIALDWDAFDRAEVVEDVVIDLHVATTDEPAGTEIRIERLRTPIGRGTVNKLARSLLLLADPFAKESGAEPVAEALDGKCEERPVDPGFKPVLLAEEFVDLQTKVRSSYFADAEYRIQAELKNKGQVAFRILDWKGDTLHDYEPEERYEAPPFQFELWVFILDGKSFSTRTSSMGEVREWLAQFGGVHVYEDAIRVPPYGGLGDDWLGLNLRRARSPEMRPSTNTAIGRVRVPNPDRRLVQKTDRIGYIENTAFLELQRCCGDALDWAARVQTRDRDRKRQAEKEAAEKQTRRASSNLDSVLARTVQPTARKQVEDAIARVLKDAGRETKALREELQLYRSLATAGMTSAVFAHEIGRPLNLIDSALKGLQKLIPTDKRASAAGKIERIAEAKLRLNSFVSIPLNLLAKQKRRSGRVNVNECVAELLRLIAPIVSYFGIRVDQQFTDAYTDVNGSEALIDGICLNFIMNAINAFQRPGLHQGDRRIQIITEYDGQVVLRHRDNAGGIEGVDLEDIWLPGVTTAPEGTGFGLTIVRDSVNDLGGDVQAVSHIDFGGAEFIVTLPPMRRLFE